MKRTIIATFLLLVAFSTSAQAQQTSPDWAAVEQALGRTGQMMPGDVYRIGMPRSDLQVTVQGVPIRPAFALGSYAAFKNMGDHTMVMGDLVLLDEEVNGVMSGLFAGGLQVTALHNHLNEMSPHVMYMHYMGMGDAVQLAGSIRSALSASGTPLGQPAAPAPADTGPQVDTAAVESTMGRMGTMMAGGVFQVSVPRLEVITDMGQEIPPAMGVAMPFNFQPTGDGTSVVTGDYVLLSNEVNPVAQALRAAGIDVTAIHNHGLNDSPRLFYMHFWGSGPTTQLAQGLRSGLDQTSARGQAWNFDTNATGTIPPGAEVFSGTWAVRAESDAPSPPNSLCQTGEAEFPALSLGPSVYKDVAVTTRFKPISGQVDQAAGIIFRVQDGQNYYILRANALENNVNFYTYIAGRRTSLAGGNVTVPSNQWQELRLEAVGNSFRGLLNGQPVVEASDSRFGMGRIGLWTKADSTTCFDAVTAAAP